MAEPGTPSPLPTWRTFRFFDVAQVPAEAALDDVHVVAYVAASAAPWAAPRGALVLGTQRGTVRIVDAVTYIELVSWSAFQVSLECIQVAPDAGAVVMVGHDYTQGPPLCKIWRLRSPEPSVWSPVLAAHARLHVGASRLSDMRARAPAAALTALATQPTLTHVAAGLSDGSVLHLRDVREQLGTSDTAVQLRVRALREPSSTEGSDEPDTVTGLAFSAPSDDAGPLHLLIATTTRTLRHTVHGPGAGASSVVDTIGCALHCATPYTTWTADKNKCDTKLVLAREEALFVIGADGREMSMALEGPKASVHTLDGQVVVVLQGDSVQRVVVFDIDARCITYTDDHAGVRLVWTSDGARLARTPDQRVGLVARTSVHLVSKSLSSKLEHLFQAHLYLQAIPLIHAHAARHPHAPLPSLPSGTAVLPLRPHERHAVSDEAVIVADVYRRYGEHLYDRGDYDGAVQQFVRTIGIVTPSFVIRKFLDAQRLQFLAVYLEALHKQRLANADHTTLLLNCYTKLRAHDSLDRFIRSTDVTFNVRVAMDVCRRAGCTEQAAYLAAAHHEHEMYLRIQVREAKQVDQALSYLRTLAPHEALRLAMMHAHALLEAAPNAACECLVALYVGADARDAALLAELLSHFVGHEAALLTFLERVVASRPPPSTPAPTETVLLYDTLLELYVEQAPDRALEILRSKDAPYTPSQALLLCSNASFTDGLLCVYERLHMVDAIMQHWVDQCCDAGNEAASARVLDALERYGGEAPHLYVMVLQFLTSSETLLARHRAQVEHILSCTLEQALLSPVQLIELLGRNSVAPLGLLTPLLLSHVREERVQLHHTQKLVQSYRQDAQDKRAELEALASTTEPRVFQNPSCGVCQQALDLPSVHFMCRHSFHWRCLPDGKTARECPLCAQAHATATALEDANAHLSLEDVQAELEAAEDGFEIVADLFSKRLLPVTS